MSFIQIGQLSSLQFITIHSSFSLFSSRSSCRLRCLFHFAIFVFFGRGLLKNDKATTTSYAFFACFIRRILIITRPA